MFSLRNLQDSKAILAVVPPVSEHGPNYGKEHSTGKKKNLPSTLLPAGSPVG